MEVEGLTGEDGECETPTLRQERLRLSAAPMSRAAVGTRRVTDRAGDARWPRAQTFPGADLGTHNATQESR